MLDRVKLRRLDRSEAIALIAAHEAWADAGLADAGLDQERLAVSVGSGIGGAQTLLAQDDILEASGAAPGLARTPCRCSCPTARPPGSGSSCGAQAGVHCVGQRLRHRRRGDRARAWTSSGPAGPTWSSPAAPRRSSTRCRSPASPRCGPCRPATTSRRGPPGRGTRAATASCSARAPASSSWSGPTTPRARGARIYARLAGAGITSDGYDIVQPHPEGAGVVRAIAQGARRRRRRRDRHRPRQRARHVDPGRRHGRDRRRCTRRSATTRCSPPPSR